MFGRRPLTRARVFRLTNRTNDNDRQNDRTNYHITLPEPQKRVRPSTVKLNQFVTVNRNDGVPTSSHTGRRTRTASMPLLLQPGSRFWVNYGRCMTLNSANWWSIQTQLLLLFCCSHFISLYTSVIACVLFNSAPPSYPLWHSTGFNRSWRR